MLPRFCSNLLLQSIEIGGLNEAKTWFTSDTHFGHAKIIEYSRRPFRDIAEMDSQLVQRWNARVGPDDTVFHLGDFLQAQQGGADVTLMWGRFGFFLLRQEGEEESTFTQVVLGPSPACIPVEHQDGEDCDRDFTDALTDWSDVEKALDENYGFTVSAKHA